MHVFPLSSFFLHVLWQAISLASLRSHKQRWIWWLGLGQVRGAKKMQDDVAMWATNLEEFLVECTQRWTKSNRATIYSNTDVKECVRVMDS